MALTSVLLSNEFWCQVQLYQRGVYLDLKPIKRRAAFPKSSPTTWTNEIQIWYAKAAVVLDRWYDRYGTSRLDRVHGLRSRVLCGMVVHAVATNNVEVYDVLSAIYDVKSANVSFLAFAVYHGNKEIIQHLLESGAQYEIKAAAREAVKSGDIDIIEMLHNVEGDWISDFVSEAGAYGHLEVFEWFRSKNILINEMCLMLAARNGHMEVVRWILKNCPFIANRSLALAAENGHIDIVHEFILNGNIRSMSQAITMAALNGHKEIAILLHSIQPLTCTRDIFARLARSNNLEMFQWVHLFLGFTCPEYIVVAAASYGHLNIVKSIYDDHLKRVPNTEKYTADQEALFYAAQNKHNQVTKWLISNAVNKIDPTNYL